MPLRTALAPIALSILLCPVLASAQPIDTSRYPDFARGQWVRDTEARWDITKPRLAQEAPLTPEAQAMLQASVAEQALGGQGNDMMSKCYPPGMPRMMIAYDPIAFAVTADVTYIIFQHMNQRRRIYTDGRDWPAQAAHTFVGYSIGRWVDPDHDGRYGALSIETRDIGGPRVFDSSGIPLHGDNQTIVKERIFLDKADNDLMHDEITTIDDALTRPWTVTRSYHREVPATWFEHVCAEDNHQVFIGRQNYFLSGDGYLMPTRKGQQPPDLRNFEQSQR
jgi:hypothetical protein